MMPLNMLSLSETIFLSKIAPWAKTTALLLLALKSEASILPPSLVLMNRDYTGEALRTLDTLGIDGLSTAELGCIKTRYHPGE